MRIDSRMRGPVEILDVSADNRGGGEMTILERLTQMLDAGEYLFILKLTRRPILDSQCLGELIACRERARRHDAVVKLVLTARQRELFAANRLNFLFEIYREEDEAMDSFTALGATEGIP